MHLTGLALDNFDSFAKTLNAKDMLRDTVEITF